VPWEEVRKKKEAAAHPEQATREPLIPRGTYALVDKNQVVLDQSQDVFGESKDMAMTGPKQTAARGGLARGGPAGGANYGGHPTTDDIFQGQQGTQQGAAAAAAAIVVTEAPDDGN